MSEITEKELEKVGILIDEKEVNTNLTAKEQTLLVKYLVAVFDNIHQRKKGISYTHNRIQTETASWFESWGYEVGFEIPLHMGTFNHEQVRFDLIAQRGKELIVIEVKDIFNKRDFGQVNYYSNMLEKTKLKAKLFLAVDFLNLFDAIDNQTAEGEIVKEIMERENVGLMFIDKEIIIICDNYEQLQLVKMPEILFSEEED